MRPKFGGGRLLMSRYSSVSIYSCSHLNRAVLIQWHLNLQHILEKLRKTKGGARCDNACTHELEYIQVISLPLIVFSCTYWYAD